MNISTRLDQVHASVKQNKWMRYFAIFNRVALAAGFLPSGYVKIIGERFTDLSNNQPMGHYLEALHHTGYYYTFIGIAQVTAALLLLIPRTVVLGAMLYLPIILNICILSMAVRFEGSLLTAPFMVLGSLYLLCWHYDKLKYIFPFNPPPVIITEPVGKINNKFPFAFFGGVLATIIIYVVIIAHAYNIMPRNTLQDCNRQCNRNENPNGCKVFCECIHVKGQPIEKALEQYNKTLNKN